MTFYSRYGKRAFDLAGSMALFVVLLPVMVVISLCIRMILGSPVIFGQMRPGLREKPFTVYKFRTMIYRLGVDGYPLPDEQRLTRFGRLLRRLSLDELPQLVNVIKGDISLVGPRPLLMEYLPLYDERQRRRHEVLPGITGWAQVNGRNDIGWKEKFALDVWYVDNYSFLCDIRILCMTVAKVLRREGINQRGSATMKAFKGNDDA